MTIAQQFSAYTREEFEEYLFSKHYIFPLPDEYYVYDWQIIKHTGEFVKRDKILDSIEFYYPDFDEQKAKIAFNVWISIDYRTDYGKSFIEHMLEEKSSYLTNLEKEILIERNKKSPQILLSKNA